MDLFPLTPFAGKRVCVAFSGGMDSVCLLHYFSSHAAQYKIHVSAVHIEHGIRGEESKRDLAFCSSFCADRKIPFEAFEVDVPAISKARKEGIESAARRIRYEIFFSLLQENKADFVTTAHHLNDEAETLLFRLARGTAQSGMKSIEHDFHGVVRPLLEVPRAKIEAYRKEYQLPYRNDSTNLDERFARNYIRSKVVPAFEKIFDHALEHLCAFAARCVRDEEYLSILAKREIVVLGTDRFVPVSLPEPLFFRACLWCMDAEKDYTEANLKEIEKLKELQSGKRVCLPKGQEAAREYEYIVFYRPAPPLEEHPFSDSDLLPPGKDSLIADLDSFPEGCTVRNRREGDFIVPVNGRKKSLKKFLTDRKIPARLKNQLPLVAFGSEILVVMGVEISERVKITSLTRRKGYFGDRITIFGRQMNRECEE